MYYDLVSSREFLWQTESVYFFKNISKQYVWYRTSCSYCFPNRSNSIVYGLHRIWNTVPLISDLLYIGCVSIGIYIYIYMCVCLCVCVKSQGKVYVWKSCAKMETNTLPRGIQWALAVFYYMLTTAVFPQVALFSYWLVSEECIQVFWNVTFCHWVWVPRRFGITYLLHMQRLRGAELPVAPRNS